MSSKKISEFPELDSGSVTNDDVLPIVNDATNKKFSWSSIKAALSSIFLQKSSNLSDVGSASAARNNILPSKTGNSLKVLRVNSAETDYELATISSGITVGSTPITSGTAGRLIYEGSGNVVQQSSNLYWDATNSRLSISNGSSPGSRLDIKAAGDLSTDYLCRMYNNSGTERFYFAANGNAVLGTNVGIGNPADSNFSLTVVNSTGSGSIYSYSSLPNGVAVTGINNTPGGTAIAFNGQVIGVGAGTRIGIHLNASGGGTNFAISIANGDIYIGGSAGTKIGTTNAEKFAFWGATPIVQPTTGVGAATLTGGGGTTLTDTDTFDGYTLKQVVKALRDAGLLA